MAPKKKTIKKTCTQNLGLESFFGEFKTEYLPFVIWHYKSDNVKIAVVDFLEDKPQQYKNKWDRIQWKMRVMSEDEEVILSGGKRLFQTLYRFCQEVNQLPTDIGLTTIYRLGNGFDTKYKMELFTEPDH